MASLALQGPAEERAGAGRVAVGRQGRRGRRVVGVGAGGEEREREASGERGGEGEPGRSHPASVGRTMGAVNDHDPTPRAHSRSQLLVPGKILADRALKTDGGINVRLFDAEARQRTAGDHVEAGLVRAHREHLTALARKLEQDDGDDDVRFALRHEFASACDHGELLLKNRTPTKSR